MVRGVSLDLHPAGDWLSDEVRRTGDFFEADVLDEIARRVDGGVLIDAGAHLGNHSAYLATFVPHRAIHAFEPLPVHWPLLERNVAPYHVTVHQVALSDRSGTGAMTIDETNLGHSRLDGEGKLAVFVEELDAYRFDHVALLKVDVEGHERQVLAGAQETIARCRPLVVIEDWSGVGYGELLPGYRLAREWERAHQTFMFEPVR